MTNTTNAPQKAARSKGVTFPPLSSMALPFALVAAYLAALWHVVQTSLETGDVYSVSWYPPSIMSILYLCMVFFGRRAMRERKPFEVSGAMFVYNLYQTLLNLWTVYAFIKAIMQPGMLFWGNEMDSSPKGHWLGIVIWLHYNNKFIELMDTTFMVLRKKEEQISFLHVYHHILLVWSWFLVAKVAMGGDSYFGACANSFIHVLMYSYYLFALIGLSMPYKRYLTQMQLLQFVACATHSMYVFYKGNLPWILPAAQLFVMVNMLYLFTAFYRKSYAKKKQEKKKFADSGVQTEGQAANDSAPISNLDAVAQCAATAGVGSEICQATEEFCKGEDPEKSANAEGQEGADETLRRCAATAGGL